MNTKTSNYLELWKIIFLTAPIWWVLGFNILIYHFTGALLTILVLQKYHHEETVLVVPQTGTMLLFLSLLYGFSVFVHSFSNDATRVLASAYNLSFWLLGSLLVIVFANVFNKEHIESFLKVFIGFSFLSGTVALIMSFISFREPQAISFPTALYGLSHYLGTSALVEKTLTVNLLWPDWIVSMSIFRFNLYSPYPTATAGIFMISIVMILTWGRIKNKLANPLFIYLMLTNFIGLCMTLSRISLFALLLSLFFIHLIQKRYAIMWTLLLIMIAILMVPLISQFFDFFLKMREGSTTHRLNLYLLSFDQLDGLDWLFGLGVRDSTYMDLPIGSHSTYLSLIFKSGIVGFVSFLLFCFFLFTRWYSLQAKVLENQEYMLFWQGMGCVFVGMSIWMVTEDIDAPQLLSFLYFSCVGIFEGFRKSVMA